jgi:hypothetical protein
MAAKLHESNVIFLADSYKACRCFSSLLFFAHALMSKVSHFKQYPAGTSQVYSYFESRGGLYPKTVFFGLQMILKVRCALV